MQGLLSSPAMFSWLDTLCISPGGQQLEGCLIKKKKKPPRLPAHPFVLTAHAGGEHLSHRLAFIIQHDITC